jgi:hypothetical protein
VDGELNELDCGVVAGFHARVCGQGHLREAEGAGEGVFAGAEELEGRDHGVAHVWRAAKLVVVVGAFVSEADVHVDECCGVALEPAWLEGDGAALC